MLSESRRLRMREFTKGLLAELMLYKQPDNRDWILRTAVEELERQRRTGKYRPLTIGDPDKVVTADQIGRYFKAHSDVEVTVSVAPSREHPHHTWLLKPKPEPKRPPKPDLRRFRHAVPWGRYLQDTASDVADLLYGAAARTGIVHVVGVPPGADRRKFEDLVRTFTASRWEDALMYQPTRLAVWMDKVLMKQTTYKVTVPRGESDVWQVTMKPTYAASEAAGKRLPNADVLVRRGAEP